MKITELLKKDTIIVELSSTTKSDVIDELANKLDNAGRLNDKYEFKKAIWNRENEFSTGIGEGIAIPHAKTSAVKTLPLKLTPNGFVWLLSTFWFLAGAVLKKFFETLFILNFSIIYLSYLILPDVKRT